MQKQPEEKQVRNPRRLLFLGPPDSGVLTLLKDLTGTTPEPRSISSDDAVADQKPDRSDSPSDPIPLRTTTAGLTHTLPLTTKYYTANIPAWLDETTDAAAWQADFAAPDAAEVVRAVGAWVVVFRAGPRGTGRETARALMAGVRAAIEAAHGGAGIWDGVCLVVGMPPAPGSAAGTSGGAAEDVDAREEWEDTCWDLGFEYVEGGVKGQEAEVRNAVGERRGVPRIREALEACEWNAVDDAEDELGLLDDDGESGLHAGGVGEETTGFGLERAQMEREFAGLKMALTDPADDDGGDENDAEQVEELERMMLRLQGVKDMSAGMPEQERKRLAANAVNDIMTSI